MPHSFQVIDQFCEQVERVRESALFAGFGNWTPAQGSMAEANLDGMGFGGMHAVLTKSLMNATGSVVVPNLTHFRVTTVNTDRAPIHSDAHAAPYTCIVYLTPNANRGATAFWRHKKTGLTSMPSNPDASLAAMLRDDMAKSSMEDWQMVDLVSGEYNRALIFNAPLFHCRFPMEDAGTDVDSGRMVWICHYFKLQEMQ